MLQHLVRRLPRATRHRVVPLVREGAHPEPWSLPSPAGGIIRPGAHWTTLVFIASVHDPACQAQLRAAEAVRARLRERGCRLYAVAPGDPIEVHAMGQRLGLGFAVCADPGARAATCLGAVTRLPGLAPRVADATVLLDPRGCVRMANRGLPNLDAVVRSLLALLEA